MVLVVTGVWGVCWHGGGYVLGCVCVGGGLVVCIEEEWESLCVNTHQEQEYSVLNSMWSKI